MVVYKNMINKFIKCFINVPTGLLGLQTPYNNNNQVAFINSFVFESD